MTNPTRGNLDAKQLELVLRRLKSKRVQVSPTASQAIPQADRSQPVPLSWAQTRLWFIGQLDPSASKAYHLPTALRLDGQLQTAAFRRALDRIVARHESLRTSFPTVHGEALTVIASPDVGFALQEQDLRGLSPAEQEARIQQATAHEADSPFDLGSGPLCRGQLLRLADDCHILLITQHHMVSDGWSIGVLVSELVALYTAYAAGQPDPLPPLPIQYADFAAWQRQRTGGDGLQAQAEFWRSYLGGAPAVLHLPFDRKRPEVQSYAGGLEEYHLPGQGLQALRSLAQRHKSTLFMALVAAWAVLMARLSGQHDIVIGTPTSGRDRSELEPLIGFFANTLALRVQLSPQMTVADLLAQVNHSVRQALAHQDLPFEQVVEVLKPERSLSYNPIFQAMLALNNTPGGGSDELPGLRLSAVKQPQTTSHFDLILNLSEDDDKLGGAFLYSADLFDVATVRRFGQYFTRLLQAMVQGDAQPVLTLAMLPDEERQQVLEGFNDTAMAYEGWQLLHQRFEARAAAQPDAPALVFESEQLSYAQLNQRANQLAHHLRSLGVRPDDRVAVSMARCTDMVVALLGVLKSGAAYLPLDPAFPGERLRYMLADSQPAVIVTHASLLQSGGLQAPGLPQVLMDSDAALLATQPTHNPDGRALQPRQLAYVIYTSGSTGRPKGVMIEHRNAVNFISWATQEFSTQQLSNTLFSTSINFDLHVFELYAPLSCGARITLVKDVLQPTPAGHAPSLVNTVPSAIQALLELDQVPDSVQQVNLAGEALKRSIVERLFAHTGVQAVANLYGPSETTTYSSWVCMQRSQGFVPTIGKPVGNTRIYILDSARQPVPLGVVGELYIGGHGVARGYLNQPELTAERFIADPFSPEAGARMYKTGDLGRWLADGQIEYLGRNDFQVKIRGFRIELGEIEAQLARCPGLAEVVVLARQASGGDGAGDQQLVAYYQARPQHTVAVQTLREHANAQLPAYMVPAAFVALERFPLTPNGKLDRAALPAPEGEAYAQRGYEAPVGDTEQALATLWAELLGVAQVGRHDNFFELGGHSLLAVSLIERMRQAGLQADVRALFAAGSLAELAQAVGGESHAVVVPPNLIPADAAEIRPEMLTLVSLSQAEIDAIVAQVPGGAANVQDIYPLAPLQEGILFHHLMAQEGDPYLLPNVYDFEDPASVERFVQTVQAVIDRHDILRTAVLWQGLAQPVQVVLRHAPLQLQTLDIDPANGDVAQQMQQRLDPLHHRIAVDQAPLLHLHVAEDPGHQQGRGRWLLHTLAHHLAFDHSSLELLIHEAQLIEQGRQQELPQPMPFRNFVAQARLGVSQAEHEAFFREMLGDVVEPTAPFGLLDVRGDGRDVREARARLSPEQALAIRQLCRRLGVSAASLMHLAWALVIARTSGREDVVFGTLLFGRMQGGDHADRVMGVFINTLPLRLQVGGQGVQQALRATHALLARLLKHEHAALALAQRCSGVDASAPLFSALLNYRHSTVPGTAQQADPADSTGSQERTNYPFVLSVDDLGEGFALTAQVSGPVEPQRVCALMEGAIGALLQALASQPGQALATLDILPPAERELLLNGWNQSAAPYEAQRCTHELVEAQALAQPDAVAVVQGDEVLSYGELNAQANQLARHLVSLGVCPGERVAVCVGRSPRLLVALLGVLKAGGAYVPLDPAYPGERLGHMLADSQPRVIVGESTASAELQALLALAAARASQPLPVLELDSPEAWHGLETHNLPAPAEGARALAYVIYTSGSTGLPKGVMVEQRSLNNLIAWHARQFGLAWGERSSCTAGLGFDACAWEIWPTLASGASLLLAPAHTEGNPQALLQWWQAQDLGVSFLVTPLAEHALSHGLANPGLRQLLVGGDRLRRWPQGLPAGQTLVNNYGPTENTVVATSGALSAHDAVLHIGRPVANTRVYILDAQGQPAPLGVVGELCIGGHGVARGYLNQPEMTAERFVADPFSEEPGARMYKTGDLGRWLADGTIEYLGRNDHQVKIRGFRIELGEIEAQLARAPGVAEVVVLAREDVAGEPRLVAYVQGETQSTVDVQALRAHASAQLPAYMVPAAFVTLDRFPLTPNGKLDRKALPAPEGEAFLSRGYEAPVGEVEQTLADLWAELLGVPQVGRHDNFFELGGHSLLAVQLISRLRSARGIELPLSELFAATSLAELAQRVAQARDSEQGDIPRVARDEPLALSLAQQRLWFLSRMGQADQAYHISGAVQLDGALDRDALQQALQRILQRHEALRTRFVQVDGQPRQCIDDARSPLSWQEQTLHALPGEADEAHAERAQALLQSLSEQPFDLETGPLLRTALIALDAQRHVLAVTMHHIVSDGWSIGVLLNELSVLYAAFARGLPDPLAPLAIQYADYAAWQRSWLDNGHYEAQCRYWQHTLADCPRVLELPADHARPAQQDFRGASLGVALDGALTAQLQALSQRHGVTLYMTLLASWGLLLGRLAGQEQVVVGSPVAGRNRAEVEPLIGFFVNTLALPVDLSENPSVAQLLGRVKAQVLGAHQHQALPFEQIVELVQPPRSLAHTPLFQVVLAWQNAPQGELRLGELELNSVGSPTTTAQFDLTLELQPSGDAVVGALNYAQALYEAPTLQRYLGYWRTLLQAMVQGDAQPVLTLAMLPDEERQQVLHTWNQSAAPYEAQRCTHELVEAQAQAQPDAVAVVQGDEVLSYGELNAQANQLARHLVSLGVCPGERVAVCVGRSPRLLVALLGVLKAGGAYVPLDPAYPGERLGYMLADSQPKVVIGQGEALLRARQALAEGQGAAALIDLDEPAAWCGAPSVALPQVHGDDLAYVIYTSGSTGLPKAAQVRHRGLSNLLAWYIHDAGLQAQDRVLVLSSHSFDLTQKNLFGPLLLGARVHLGAEPFDPQRIAAQIRHEGITWLNMAPSAFHALIDGDAQALQGLRCVVLGGEPIQAARLAQMAQPRPVFINSYGPTECSDVVAWHRLEADLGRYAQGVPLGRPVRHCRVHVLDAHGQLLPVGVVGEIHIGGLCVGAGYLHQPEMTAERFIEDPFSDEAGARLYKTGDLGRWLADGTIEYLGRNDHQVKIRGFRIELGEIEAQLAKAPGVAEVVVLAREAAGGDKRLVAYYRGEAPAQALREHASGQLPPYMVPAAFVALERFPLTPNGKLDRNALPAPEGEAFVSRGYEAPQGEVEQTLATLWSELLGVPQVGRHDNFFELGGHSLLAVQVLVRIRQAFDIELSLNAVLAQPTVEAIATQVLTAALNRYSADDVAQAQAELEGLSDEELAALLAETTEPGQPN